MVFFHHNRVQSMFYFFQNSQRTTAVYFIVLWKLYFFLSAFQPQSSGFSMIFLSGSSAPALTEVMDFYSVPCNWSDIFLIEQQQKIHIGSFQL